MWDVSCRVKIKSVHDNVPMKVTLVKGCDPYVLGRLQAKNLKPLIMLLGRISYIDVIRETKIRLHH